jgi:predicted RNase H-like HicB family nuclease
MLMTYPAIIHHEDGEYWGEIEGFAGVTQEETLEEVLTETQTMLGLMIATYLERDESLPEVVDIKSITTDENSFTTYIQVDPTPYIRDNNTIRKNVTVPEWLAKRAEKAHINFSETLTNALYQKLYK